MISIRDLYEDTSRRFESVLIENLDLILSRYSARPDYPFIDTKLSLIDGADFDSLPDEKKGLRGSECIYSWIQGRGLEALFGHAEWLAESNVLPEPEKSRTLLQIETVLRDVSAEVERLRQANGGHMYFCTDRGGRPVNPNSRWEGFAKSADAVSTMSDLFCCKGLFAAYMYLHDAAAAERTSGWFKRILADIEAGRFVNDQFFWGNADAAPQGVSHAPRMIALGGLSLFARLSGDAFYLDTAADFIRHIMDRHVNNGRFPGMQRFDFIEFLSEDGTPWGGETVVSDPGHSLEFAGLASRALRLMEQNGRTEHARLLESCRKMLPEILIQNFNNGFNRVSGGICKTFNLISRQPLDGNMPWWSLPETVRAAAMVLALAPEAPRRHEILQIIEDCAGAYLNKYVNPAVGCMAYQTRDAEGRVVDIPPATPDADPCYHTGLSIIDFLRLTAR